MSTVIRVFVCACDCVHYNESMLYINNVYIPRLFSVMSGLPASVRSCGMGIGICW